MDTICLVFGRFFEKGHDGRKCTFTLLAQRASPQIRGGGRCQSDLPKQAHGPVVTPLVDRLSWRGEGKISSRSLPRAETRRYDTHQLKLERHNLGYLRQGAFSGIWPAGSSQSTFHGSIRARGSGKLELGLRHLIFIGQSKGPCANERLARNGRF